MSELLIVENSSSRRGREALAEVRRCLEERSARGAQEPREVRVVPVSRLGDTEPRAARLVAVGGDGTVNAVAAWAIANGLRCPLGIVPAGTGNNLAGGLGLPRGLREACAVALDSHHTALIDAVRYGRPDSADRRVFVQSAGIGFPADIARRYDELRRHRAFRIAAAPLGTRIYTVLALLGLAGKRWRELRGETFLHVSTEIDGERISADVLAVFLGNEPTLGGNFIPCPRARVDDGRIDVCLLLARRERSYARLLARVKRGRHLELEDCVVYRQTARPFELRLSRPCAFLADGDSWVQGDRYRLEIAPSSLAVTVADSREGSSATAGDTGPRR